MHVGLVIAAFVAGLFTFLAPCTLPLVPAYLAFISGVSLKDLADDNKARAARRKILANSLLYVLGFSVVFIFFGILFGVGGESLRQYRPMLQRIGGILVIFFGLYMMKVFRLPGFQFLDSERRFPAARIIKPGNPLSSFLFGSVFALGWTPCIGPILGSILTLAAASATVVQGGLLLAVFSLGLGVPFIAIAAGIGSAGSLLKKMESWIGIVSPIGGLFLVIMGLLLFTGAMGAWVGFFYRITGIIHLDFIFNYF